MIISFLKLALYFSKNCLFKYSLKVKMTKIFLSIIKFYQQSISPMFPASCRYVPTCSEYSKQAFIKYGAFKGIWLSLKRILRCHPFGGHGYDPVP